MQHLHRLQHPAAQAKKSAPAADDSDCCVCLQPLQRNFIVMRCKHALHPLCTAKFYVRQQLACPLCRQFMIFTNTADFIVVQLLGAWLRYADAVSSSHELIMVALEHDIEFNLVPQSLTCGVFFLGRSPKWMPDPGIMYQHLCLLRRSLHLAQTHATSLESIIQQLVQLTVLDCESELVDYLKQKAFMQDLVYSDNGRCDRMFRQLRSRRGPAPTPVQ